MAVKGWLAGMFAREFLRRKRTVSAYSNYVWTTAEGDVMTLAFMRTEHMFYAFRMLYDLIAEREGWEPMREPGQGLQASEFMYTERAAEYMAWFATDIILRRDLPAQHCRQFERMMAQIMNRPCHTQSQILPAPKQIPQGK